MLCVDFETNVRGNTLMAKIDVMKSMSENCEYGFG